MGMKFGKGIKINGQTIQETIQKKIVVCTQKKCSFGKKKIDDYCSICRFLGKDILYSGEIEPVFIEVKEQFIFKSCFTKEKIPMYEKCPFGFKGVSDKCNGCARAQIQLLHTETREIK